jgi:hypothetical protein
MKNGKKVSFKANSVTNLLSMTGGLLLPFLKKRQEGYSSGVIVKQRQPDEVEDKKDEMSESHMAFAKDLLQAIESKDVKGIAEALNNAFQIMDAEPHVEGDHIEKHSYDAQNQKAGQENR